MCLILIFISFLQFMGFLFEIIIEMSELCSINSKPMGKKVQTKHTSFTSSPRVNMMGNNYKTQW